MRIVRMQPLIHVRDVLALRRCCAEASAFWIVDVRRQCLYGWTGDEWLRPRPVSTAVAGLGNRPGSQRTPLGLLQVREVIGVGQPIGQPFVERKAVGVPCTEWIGGTGDRILSRIITVTGRVGGLNENSQERYIYLHGTDQEEKLGTPCSHGCIRMANRDIVEMADALGELRPFVWVGSVGQFSELPA